MSTTTKERLLEKYFEVKEGIELEDFLEKIEDVKNIWQEFHHILRNQVKYFYKQETIQGIKIIAIENKPYLFIRLHPQDYLVIDIETKRVIDREKAKTLFDADFFIENFKEEEKKYLFLNSCKNPEEILNFYLENESVLKLSSFFCYSIQDKEACSDLYIDFVGKNSHISFFANKQGLKEQYFWETQSSRNNDLFDKIMKIKIPYHLIPNEILEEENRIRTRSIPR